jgi:catechol 2,3-dioxygenase-like lactoylglutathione lyase family enzyme
MASGIQHVSVPRPGGSAASDEAVAFYSGVLGATHIPSPDSLNHLDLTWFRWGDDEIHVFAAEERDAGKVMASLGAHFCMAVEDLEGTRRRLQDAGVPCMETDPIPGRPRFFTVDPFGNRIEISHIEDGT